MMSSNSPSQPVQAREPTPSAPQPGGACVSVVVPFYNEQDNVDPLLTEIDQVLAQRDDVEIVAVDDGSTDATPAALAEAGANIPRLRVVRLQRNSGQSAAIANGVVAARGRLVVTLDGDGQNPPPDIPALIEHHERNAGAADGAPLLVIGWRQSRQDNWLRKLSSRLANGVRGRLLRDDCPDTGCGLRAFARADFLNLPRFNHMHRFLPALYRRAGGRVENVPVGHRPRQHGKSKYGVNNRLWVGLVDLVGVAWLIKRPCTIEWNTIHAANHTHE